MSPTRRDILKTVAAGALTATTLAPSSPARANCDARELPMVITFGNPDGRDVIATVVATIDRSGVTTIRMTNRLSGVPEQTYISNASAIWELMRWLAAAQKTIGAAIEQDREGHSRKVREEAWGASLERQAERDLLGEPAARSADDR